MTEEWRDVVGFEDRYEVSNLGRVRSKAYWKSGRNNNGPFKYLTTPKLLKFFQNEDGYLRVKLQLDGLKESWLVHRVVASAYLPQPEPDKTQVNHKNSIRNDNRVDNLEWVTPSENSLHGFAEGNHSVVGAKHPRAKFTDEDILVVRRRSAAGETYASIAKDYGVSYQAISYIARKLNWSHIN